MSAPTPLFVLQEVAAYFGLDRRAILGRNRRGSVALARHVFCYLARQHTARNLEEIGRFIGRDHTTILNSIRVIDAMLNSENLQLAKHLADLERKIGAAPLDVRVTAGDVLVVVGGRGAATLMMPGCGDYPWER